MTYKDIIENMLESNSELDDEISIKVKNYEGETEFDVDNVEIQYDRLTRKNYVVVYLVEKEEEAKSKESDNPVGE